MDELVMICRGCRKPVAGGTGGLRVLHGDITRAAQEERSWTDKFGDTALSIEDLMAHPNPPHWLAYHYECDPAKGESSYCIAAERLRTWPNLAWWTAHLMEKTWFAASDWDCLLRELGGEGGSGIPVIRVTERAAR